MISKVILITGSTDGIGLATARLLLEQGQQVLIHGRTQDKVDKTLESLRSDFSNEKVEGYVADLTDLSAVKTFADTVKNKRSSLDVLINNAGVFKIPNPMTNDGLDSRFVVNTLVPFYLTSLLEVTFKKGSRIVNLSSAAQRPVNIDALTGNVVIEDDFEAYAQSKLALTMWSHQKGLEMKSNGIMMVAVNPGSMLASNMVKEGFGVQGNDLSIGADILSRAALSDEFNHAYGLYYDNDIHAFNKAHPDIYDRKKYKTIENELCLLVNN